MKVVPILALLLPRTVTLMELVSDVLVMLVVHLPMVLHQLELTLFVIPTVVNVSTLTLVKLVESMGEALITLVVKLLMVMPTTKIVILMEAAPTV